MNYSKWLAVTLSALAVAACGGDSDEETGAGDGGGSGSIPYYTLDYASSDAFRQLYQAVMPIPEEGETSVTLRLGNSDLVVRLPDSQNSSTVIDGYRLANPVVGPAVSAALLCSEDSSTTPVRHALLPPGQVELTGTLDEKLDRLKSKRFYLHEKCGYSVQLVFDAQGNLQIHSGGVQVPGEDESAANIKLMLSDAGYTRTDDGEEVTSWIRLHEIEGWVFGVMFDRVVAGGLEAFQIMLLLDENLAS